MIVFPESAELAAWTANVPVMVCRRVASADSVAAAANEAWALALIAAAADVVAVTVSEDDAACVRATPLVEPLEQLRLAVMDTVFVTAADVPATAANDPEISCRRPANAVGDAVTANEEFSTPDWDTLAVRVAVAARDAEPTTLLAAAPDVLAEALNVAEALSVFRTAAVGVPVIASVDGTTLASYLAAADNADVAAKSADMYTAPPAFPEGSAVTARDESTAADIGSVGVTTAVAASEAVIGLLTEASAVAVAVTASAAPAAAVNLELAEVEAVAVSEGEAV